MQQLVHITLPVDEYVELQDPSPALCLPTCHHVCLHVTMSHHDNNEPNFKKKYTTPIIYFPLSWS